MNFDEIDELANDERRMHEREMGKWDRLMPGWETDEIDPEARRFVSEADVLDSDKWVLRVPDFALMPPAHAD